MKSTKTITYVAGGHRVLLDETPGQLEFDQQIRPFVIEVSSESEESNTLEVTLGFSEPLVTSVEQFSSPGEVAILKKEHQSSEDDDHEMEQSYDIFDTLAIQLSS